MRLRSGFFAVLLGLLVGVCWAQDPVAPGSASSPSDQSVPAPSAAGQGQAGTGQTPQDQTPGNPAPQAQAPQNQAPENPAESSSKEEQGQAPQPTAPQGKGSKNKVPKSNDPQPPVPQRPAQEAAPVNPAIALDANETVFSFLTALNACGYDQDLTVSDATRSNVRAEVQRNLRESEEAGEALTAVCEFVQGHVASRDPNRNLSQYISLALYVDGPPHFLPRRKDEDLPPDAAAISNFGALMEHFYTSAGLHSIWVHHRYDYAAAMRRYHEPLAKMVFDTEIYLKQPSSQYLGRRFTIYLDFMGSPNQTDARNYGPDYYVIVFPAPDTNSGVKRQGALKMDEIRHTFLHYELDPLADKHMLAIKRLEPLLQSVKRAPLEDSFKTDISLLVTECLVRAIETRTAGNKQTAEAMRAQAVDDAVKQGYILTRYFYNAMIAFEKDPVGLKGTYGDLLEAVDIKKEERAAAEVQFASVASPELVRLSRPEDRRLLMTAEKRLAAGDAKGAQELAQQALDKKIGDQGRALFILAQVAVANKNRDGAEDNFQKAIQSSQDPTVLGWSHVYLGRILDMKEDREAAVQQYQAALTAGGKLPEIRAAAEKGLAQAYEPPAKPQSQ